MTPETMRDRSPDRILVVDDEPEILIALEDLLAEGPGTLTPASTQISKGKGVRSNNGWMVVLRRPVPAGLAPRARTQVAFAVWEGSHGEVGARKMRTGWIPLLIETRSQ